MTGESIKTSRGHGRPLWSTWHNRYPDFEALTSIHSEVAIHPDPKKFFLPNSQSKIFDQQEKMITEHSAKVGKTIHGVEAIMGEVADYIELTFQHLDKTGERLFGEKYGYNYTRTKTPTFGSSVAYVGYFSADGGPGVVHWIRGSRFGDVGVAPLVVPV